MTNIQDTVKNLNKKYGVDTASLASKTDDIKVESVSTGCYSFDKIIGVDGVPLGRIIDLYGLESQGKSTVALHIAAQFQKAGKVVGWLDTEQCIHGDSEIVDHTNGKFYKVKDIVDNKKNINVVSCKDLSEINILSSNMDSVLGGKKEKLREGVKITTKLGKTLIATPEHKVLVYKKNGQYGWIEMSHIKNGDFVATPKLIKYFGNEKKNNEAILLGYFIGNGTFVNSVRIVLNKDSNNLLCLKNAVKELGDLLSIDKEFDNYFNLTIKKKNNIGGRSRRSNSQKILDKFGLRGKKSNNKFLPSEVFNKWDRESIALLLRSLWETDGGSNRARVSIAYSSASLLLIKQMQILLLRFEIVSYITSYKDKRKSSYYISYKLSINGSVNVELFLKYIGLISYKKDVIEQSLLNKKINKFHYGYLLPDYSTKKYKDRKQYINHSDIIWDKIIKIEKAKKFVPYDLSIKNNKNYFANNILVHNCYTNEYAKALGVDTSKLILLQPIYGEQAMNALVDLVNPKDGKPVCSLVVVDSTANITSRKEIENDMEKDTIALQARLIGRALRVITAPAAKNKVTVLFISQLRNRIGMFVGTGYVATGGMALKFYSSVRMRVSTIKKLKGKNDSIIGNRLKIKVEKNKVAKPFGEAEVDLYFERGIDIVGDILDVATGEGIVAKSGNTYSYAGNKIGVGRTATIKYLEDHKEVFTEVKKQLLAIDKELLIKQNK